MKKSFLIVLGLVIAFASLFVSCSDDNDIVNDDKEVVICNVSISKIGDGSVCFKDYSETAMAIFSGNTVTVIATPGESNFTGWFIGESEEPVSTEATYTFVVTKNVSLVAKFNKWPLVSIRSGGNGTVSFENSSEFSQYIQPGEEVTVVAIPNKKYEFIGWYIGDSETAVSTEATYTFTVAENVTLVAKFNKWPLVSISSGANGSVCFENSSELSQYIQIGEEVTVVATPNEKCEFLGWFVGNSNEPVSTDATYTFTVSENVALVAKFEKIRTYLNGYEYVDLGLPSGLKWANYNVGATSPEDYGGYYAWGETEEKEDYSWETYKWCNGSHDTMTKYCTNSSYGTVDNKTVLDPEDDVAHVKWGGDWRMPTKAEQDELRNNCSWAWTTQNGANGYKVTGPNGNSIFLPAAGYRDGTGGRGHFSYYWSGSLSSNNSNNACSLGFYDGGWYYISMRCSGLSVRPVCK